MVSHLALVITEEQRPSAPPAAVLTNMIMAGALVINQWLLGLPKYLRSSGYRFDRHWRIYTADTNRQVHRTLADAGWHFFRMEPLVRARAISRRREEALRRALGKVLRQVQNENLNALEILTVNARERFGWCYVSIVGQPRQVQVSSGYEYGGCGQVYFPVAS